MAFELNLAEFERTIVAVSADVRRALDRHVTQAGAAAVSRLRAEYPLGPTGNLRRAPMLIPPRGWNVVQGVVMPAVVVHVGPPFGPHRHLVEGKTRQRESAGGFARGEGSRAGNKKGNRGRMNGRPIFVPVMASIRESLHRNAQRVLDETRTF